jgi:hypothetical protein
MKTYERRKCRALSEAELKSLAEGYLVVHGPGTRVWLQKESTGLIECECDFSLKNAEVRKHYEIRLFRAEELGFFVTKH